MIYLLFICIIIAVMRLIIYCFIPCKCYSFTYEELQQEYIIRICVDMKWPGDSQTDSRRYLTKRDPFYPLGMEPKKPTQSINKRV